MIQKEKKLLKDITRKRKYTIKKYKKYKVTFLSHIYRVGVRDISCDYQTIKILKEISRIEEILTIFR